MLLAAFLCAAAVGDECRNRSGYWFNWSFRLAPFPATVRFKDQSILKRGDFFGMGTGFELWYLPESEGPLALVLGLDGDCTVHFLKDTVTRRQGFTHTTMFDVATYAFCAEASISYCLKLGESFGLNLRTGFGMLEVNVPRGEVREDGPHWEGQNNWVLGNFSAGLAVDISRRWSVEYAFECRRPVPHTAGLHLRLGQQERDYGRVVLGGSVDGRTSYVYIGYEKRKMWADNS
jgi:hypothetical protein